MHHRDARESFASSDRFLSLQDVYQHNVAGPLGGKCPCGRAETLPHANVPHCDNSRHNVQARTSCKGESATNKGPGSSCVTIPIASVNDAR
eukprot:1122361-Rhodomonas_salina.1